MATALTVADARAAPIRVAVVDDHPLVREGTAALLGAQPGLEIVGTADTVQAAATLLEAASPDVVVLDIRLGQDSGLTLLRGSDGPAVVIVTSYDYPQYADAALRLGAAGFVLKTAPVSELVDAIRHAAAGGLSFASRPRRGGGAPLSARELDVVRLVVDGRSNDEIAAALGIGAKTVESHLGRLFERFAISSRTELATRALREGWLDVPPG